MTEGRQAFYSDAEDRHPPITPEYLSILSRRWAEKIPGIVATAIQEAFPGERSRHAR